MNKIVNIQSSDCKRCGNPYIEAIYVCPICGHLYLGENTHPQFCTACCVRAVKVQVLGCADCNDARDLAEANQPEFHHEGTSR